MIRLKQVTRGVVLAAALLCLIMPAGVAMSSPGQDVVQESHAVDTHHDQGSSSNAHADTGHVADGGDAHATDGHHGHGDSLSPEKVKDLGWRVMNFLALMFILIKFAAKPIAGSLADRRKQIREEIESLESKKTEAERSYREFEAKLGDVEAKAGEIVEKAVAQAEKEKVAILEKAEQVAEDLKRQAELAVANEITQARQDLKNDNADQAAVIAEGLIVSNLTDDDQVQIIETYMDKVGAIQ